MKAKEIRDKVYDEIIKHEQKSLAETKFHHGQSLRVIKGYYKGAIVRIEDFRIIEKENPMQAKVTIQLDKLKTIYYSVITKDNISLWLPEEFLQKTFF
jgi:hypothetical protein